MESGRQPRLCFYSRKAKSPINLPKYPTANQKNQCLSPARQSRRIPSANKEDVGPNSHGVLRTQKVGPKSE
ncbi:hypothetical protein L484_025211 [Morus notabilis]|uniref:Uncharacterized protein n=1 Tax=Morus notabilis TaxID=981085 RepID=W9RUC0_9ROSA|nr:hypothetical protein L484_025211 [Morus notabilis]